MALKTITIEKRICDYCGEEMNTKSFNLNQGVNIGKGLFPTTMTCTIEIRDIKVGPHGDCTHHPDLCPDCARKILKKLMESLPCSPKVVKE